MTGRDILEKAERYIGRKPDELVVIDGIQEAINWLGNKGYIIDTINVNATAKQRYDLPSDLIRIIKIENQKENKYYYNYILDGNRIRFGDDGEYKIFAEKHPFLIENIDKDLNLHSMLEGCVLTYVKGHCKVVLDDTSEDGHRLLKKFKEDAVMAYRTLKRGQANPSKVKVIRHA